MVSATKVFLLCTLLLGIAACVISYGSGYTFYILRKDEPASVAGQKQRNKGDIVLPLEELDFSQGAWSAYIVLSYDDHQKIKSKISRNCLKLTDQETLKKMKEDWKMIYTGADLATVSSHILFLKDNKIVFSSGIVLGEDGQEGLQNRDYGFIAPQNNGSIWQYCSKFEPVLWPVIILS